jgi:hypothetical protein
MASVPNLPPPPSLGELRAIAKQIDGCAQSGTQIEEITQLVAELTIGHYFPFPRFLTGGNFYRARPMPDSRRPENISEVGIKPREYCRAFQRCNRPGRPMFYCSDHPSAPLREVHARVGDHVVLSRWTNTKPLMVAQTGYSESTFHRLKAARMVPEWTQGQAELLESHRLQHDFVNTYLSELFSQEVPEGCESLYRPSIAITEQFIGVKGIGPLVGNDDLTIEGIMYPTISLRASCENLALAEGFASDGLKLLEACFVRVFEADDRKGYRCDLLFLAKEISRDGTLNWMIPRPLKSTWEYSQTFPTWFSHTV